MTFFSDFDGNNVLFLAWIILIFLLVFDVDGTSFKITRRKRKSLEDSGKSSMINGIFDRRMNTNRVYNISQSNNNDSDIKE